MSTIDPRDEDLCLQFHFAWIASGDLTPAQAHALARESVTLHRSLFPLEPEPAAKEGA